jgi:protein involved in polysaccharide export with SLBB domain
MSFFVASGCATNDAQNLPSAGATNLPPARATSDVLRVGDEVTIEFRGVPIPPERHVERIKQDGTIRPPVVDRDGPVQAAGLTRLQLENELGKRYEKFYKHLTVTVSTENRVFYVGGEVRTPSRQPYQGEMTVLKAIASAGGFTDFAKKSNVQLIRANGQKFKVDCRKALKDSKLDLAVYPDDQIHVPRRYY